ncbi:MAG TPA: hypothetical protein VE842_06150 [Pyrinomonadaceae bacterium]|jgi:hypothetical protein|nr:hypothetical protein [Pyrinomonadaceae bacterium]
MNSLTELEALAQLQRAKASFQTHIKLNYEHAAADCRTCAVRGLCCTDAHFVNVHITRLEAVAIRETLARTPRLTVEAKRAVYSRAREAVARYHLRASGETFAQTFACPLYAPEVGCLVHARAKPAPCIQHACYDAWEDLPPTSLQARSEHRVEQLNTAVYGAAWAWLSVPVWLTLVDPSTDGMELERLARLWATQRVKTGSNPAHAARQPSNAKQRTRRYLPVIKLG